MYIAPALEFEHGQERLALLGPSPEEALDFLKVVLQILGDEAQRRAAGPHQLEVHPTRLEQLGGVDIPPFVNLGERAYHLVTSLLDRKSSLLLLTLGKFAKASLLNSNVT